MLVVRGAILAEWSNSGAGSGLLWKIEIGRESLWEGKRRELAGEGTEERKNRGARGEDKGASSGKSALSFRSLKRRVCYAILSLSWISFENIMYMAAAHSLHGYHTAGMTPEMPTFTRTTSNATVYTASSTPFDDGIISGEEPWVLAVKVPLTWKQWLEIGIGAARGLKHLHQGLECEIIHQDIKTTDISLDEKRVAKFADFGVVLFEVLRAGLAVEGSLMKECSLRGTETKAMQCYAEGRWKGFRD
ncbi:putative receptor-like protein kinase [Vitis vinifera]|uniref:Putative receptor-like protein kinase n=1 Tax=Vitis vinifera TaxID=29760 RepID=A0A438JIS2_VITVI|nr:putative receptor-like protein kinase [Vitis vinifera]